MNDKVLKGNLKTFSRLFYDFCPLNVEYHYRGQVTFPAERRQKLSKINLSFVIN